MDDTEVIIVIDIIIINNYIYSQKLFAFVMMKKLYVDIVATINLIAAIVTLYFCIRIIYKHLLR